MLRQIPGLVGWRYIRVRKGSKQPQDTDWPTPHDQPQAVKDQWPGNWGILAGAGPDAGQYLLCVDQDVKGAANGLGEFARLDLPPTYHKETPSGGRHSLYWAPTDFRPFKRHDLGLEFLGKGQQFLAPGSVVDGKEYPDGNGLRIVPLGPEDLEKIRQLRGPHAVSDRDLVEGNRNNALFKRACAARELDGLDDNQVGDLLANLNADLVPPLGANEIHTIWKSVCKFPAGSPGEPPPDPDEWTGETLKEFALFNDLLPRRLHCLGPFLTGSTAFVFGMTGHGKSFLMTAALHAMSRGEKLGPWAAGDRAFRVGYVDGEMHRFDTQERFTTFINWGDLVIYHRSKMPTQLNLANPAHHEIIQKMAADVDVLAIDNFHSLAFALNTEARDYSPAVWQACQPLVAWFRDNNKLLWIADHANQQGQQQGDKTKQWNVDLALRLDASDYQQDPGLQFDVDVIKGRQKGDAKLITFSLVGSMLLGAPRQTEAQWIQDLFNDGMTRAEIADETGLTVRKIYGVLKGQKARKLPTK